MLTFEKAYEIVFNSVKELGFESVNLSEALNRILAEDVRSDIDIPPFNRAAMDGYACRKEDIFPIRNELEVIEIIPAGKVPTRTIGKNQCAKIMTGAMLPPGADCVIILEETKESADGKVIFTRTTSLMMTTEEKSSENIIYQGEDIKAGEIVLKKGTKILPQHIAILATVGCTNPKVFKKPSVVIIPTGDELVCPEQKPVGAQIRDSNSFQLKAQLEQLGINAEQIPVVQDSPEKMDKLLKTIISPPHIGNQRDVVIFSGGVSKGDYDFIPEVLEKNNINVLFDSMAIKPGKPTVFGIYGNTYFFGVPGNPVSTFVIFEILIKPFLYKLMGFDYTPVNLKLPIGVDYKQKKADRLSVIPIRIRWNNEKSEVFPVEYHGSAHIHSYCNADGFMLIPIGKTLIKKEELVDVRQI